MKPVILHDRCVLFHGDSSKLGEVLAPDSIDAIVCDPPAGIGFMGKNWDGDKGGRDAWIAWLADTLAPSFAALKPGGHALVWALPRTSHWTALALERVGFEIRDRVSHLFGTGFPKSMNVSKAIDAHLGKERPVVGRAKGAASDATESLGSFAPEYDATIAGSPEAAAWDGWGDRAKTRVRGLVVGTQTDDRHRGSERTNARYGCAEYRRVPRRGRCLPLPDKPGLRCDQASTARPESRSHRTLARTRDAR